MKQARERREDQPAFVLHALPYRETSLIVEALTADYGRVALVARGAKRPRSELRGVLQAFQPLTLSWAGAGEIKPMPVPDSPAEALDRLSIPADAMARIVEALSTGGSIIVSDQGINAGETGEGTDFIVSLR